MPVTGVTREECQVPKVRPLRSPERGWGTSVERGCHERFGVPSQALAHAGGHWVSIICHRPCRCVTGETPQPHRARPLCPNVTPRAQLSPERACIRPQHGPLPQARFPSESKSRVTFSRKCCERNRVTKERRSGDSPSGPGGDCRRDKAVNAAAPERRKTGNALRKCRGLKQRLQTPYGHPTWRT